MWLKNVNVLDKGCRLKQVSLSLSLSFFPCNGFSRNGIVHRSFIIYTKSNKRRVNVRVSQTLYIDPSVNNVNDKFTSVFLYRKCQEKLFTEVYQFLISRVTNKGSRKKPKILILI